MAGPHVAGVVALMISANPALAGQVDTIESIIRQTARPRTDTIDCGGFSGMNIPNPLYGWGRIDALAAVQEALSRITTSSETTIIKEGVYSFPNPFSNELNLEIYGFKGQSTFSLYNMMGRLVVFENFSGNLINKLYLNTNELAKGIYFYSVNDERKSTSGKIIKQ